MKFKFTWGHGVILALVSFMIFILVIIFNFAYSGSNAFDLVTEEYYDESLQYEDIVSASQNTQKLSQKPEISLVETEGILIHFIDSTFSSQNTTGTIQLYRPSDDELDQQLALDISKGNKMFIPKTQLKSGKYILKLFWKRNEEPFYVETELVWK